MAFANVAYQVLPETRPERLVPLNFLALGGLFTLGASATQAKKKRKKNAESRYRDFRSMRIAPGRRGTDRDQRLQTSRI
jgi:hypothetical protein